MPNSPATARSTRWRPTTPSTGTARHSTSPDSVDTPSRQRVEVLIGLGTAQRQAGHPEHRRTLLDAARLADQAGEGEQQVKATLAGFRNWFSVSDQERLVGISRALEIVGDVDTPERARLLVYAANERVYETSFDERIQIVEQATVIGRRVADPELLLWILAYGCTPVRGPQSTTWRVERLAEARSLLTESSRPEVRICIEIESMLVALDVGDAMAIDHHFARAREYLTRVPEPAHRWADAYLSATPLMLRGQLEQAERVAESALAIGTERGQPMRSRCTRRSSPASGTTRAVSRAHLPDGRGAAASPTCTCTGRRSTWDRRSPATDRGRLPASTNWWPRSSTFPTTTTGCSRWFCGHRRRLAHVTGSPPNCCIANSKPSGTGSSTR